MVGLSGIRPVRRFRLLLAHDTNAPTCDRLILALEEALGNVDLTDASSVEDARVALDCAAFHVSLVCLDLPPAPLAGVRLAQYILSRKQPVVLITRSLRWIPENALALRQLPWVSPDAHAKDVAKAISDAISTAEAAEEPASTRIPIPSEAALEGTAPLWLEAEGAAPVSASHALRRAF